MLANKPAIYTYSFNFILLSFGANLSELGGNHRLRGTRISTRKHGSAIRSGTRILLQVPSTDVSILSSSICKFTNDKILKTRQFQAHGEPRTERSLRRIGQRVSRRAARGRAVWPAGRQLSQVAEQLSDAQTTVVHGDGIWRRP